MDLRLINIALSTKTVLSNEVNTYSRTVSRPTRNEFVNIVFSPATLFPHLVYWILPDSGQLILLAVCSDRDPEIYTQSPTC